MSEEKSKETKEAIKRQIKARKELLKAMALSVSLSGAVANNAQAKTFNEPEPQGLEITYEPQSDISGEENSITLEQAEAMARNYRRDDAPQSVSYRRMPATGQEYAIEMGLKYDARLSRGLDRYGNGHNFDGWAGAYINPYAENRGEEVIFLPNDMVRDRHCMRTTSIAYAQYQQEARTDMYFHEHNGPKGRYDVHKPIPHPDPRHTPEPVRKVKKTVKKVTRVAREVNHLIDAIQGDRRGR